jgi:hypothetical protein
MKKLVCLLAALGLVAATAGVAAGARNAPPRFPKLQGNWSHIEINVKIKGAWHTLILDRGRIIVVTSSELTLRAPDGTKPTIPIGPQTLITFGRAEGLGFRARPLVIRRGLFAETMRIDGGPAVRVRLALLR